jgi:hypothetical protein
VLTHTWISGEKIQYILIFPGCWKAQLTGMRKRAGRKEYKEKDREDGGRMVKR